MRVGKRIPFSFRRQKKVYREVLSCDEGDERYELVAIAILSFVIACLALVPFALLIAK